MIAELVQVESPTEDRAAVNRCVALLEKWIRPPGARASAAGRRQPGTCWWAALGRCGGPPVMLLGHLDTVWPLGTLKKMPFRLRGGRAWGPGVLDMKAGVVMAVTALRLLSEAELGQAGHLAAQ